MLTESEDSEELVHHHTDMVTKWRIRIKILPSWLRIDARASRLLLALSFLTCFSFLPVSIR